MKKTTFLSTIAATAVLLAASPAAKAISPMLGLVTPGDTFSIDVSAFNYAGTSGYLLTSDEDVTFGTTNTFTGIDGSNTTAAITISSSETTNALAGTTTDTFTISTPTNFLGAAKYNNLTIGLLQFDLGDANSGSDTVDYALPVTGSTSTGTVLYGATETAITLTPTTTLTNGTQSLSAVEGIKSSGGLYSFAINSFSYSVTYNTIPALVPEPSTWAMMGLGLVAGGAVVIRRRKLAA